MNLRERLEKTLGTPGAPAAQEAPAGLPGELRSRLERLMEKRESLRSEHPPSEEALGGEVVATAHGEAVVVKRTYPLSHTRGKAALGDALDLGGELLELMGNDPRLAHADIGRYLFLDTETTGLSGGAGTCAFLVGAGFFRDGEFHLHQLFMRDFDEEAAMLDSLHELLRDIDGVVTFNGKAFDVPLLEERFIMQRRRVRLRELPHVDLVFPSRRLWRGLYGDCRLVTLEERILGVKRRDDIESWLIPSCWFDFIRTGQTAMLRRIFSHNRRDIISLVALLARIGAVLADPVAESGEGLVNAGRFHQERGDRDVARGCLEAALTRTADPVARRDAARRLSLQYRREGRFEEAASLWREMIDEDRSDPFPLIELAKHYEHREKDPARALSMVRQVRTAAGGDELARRTARLERKIHGERKD